MMRCLIVTKYKRIDLLRINEVSRNYEARISKVLRIMKEMLA